MGDRLTQSIREMEISCRIRKEVSRCRVRRNPIYRYAAQGLGNPVAQEGKLVAGMVQPVWTRRL